MTQYVILASVSHERNLVQTSCPSAPPQVATKSCQTYSPKAPRIHFFLYNTLPLLITIACPTYIPTVTIISHVSPLSPIPEWQVVFVSCANFNGWVMDVQSATLKKILSTCGLSRKGFYVGSAKSALRHCSYPSFLSLSVFVFF